MNKFCPICRKKTMKKAGKIKAGPRRGFRSVYLCSECGYRSIR